jgi:hypothetical protein
MLRTFKYTLLMAAIFLASHNLLAAPQQLHFDLAVYGSTPGGIAAAVAAAREGMHVAVIDNGHHVGGMAAGGLSTSDRGNTETIGGISHEFFERVGHHYNERIEWDFEPHVAEQVFNDLLSEAHVTVFFNQRLRETDGVTKQGARIMAITMEDGSVFSATEFVDGSYEGDLMAQAGVSYTWGREAASQYHESWAGVLSTNRYQDYDHQFPVRVSPYASDGSLLPGVSTSPMGEFGEGDKKLPAYTFRMCFTNNKANQAPFPKPDGYDPRRYDLLARYLVALQSSGHTIRVGDMTMPIALRNEKFDVNNHGPISTDGINANWDYPNASYKRREEIIKEQYNYEAGFFYFLAHDPRVPANLQNEFNQYGLAKDEFTDTNNWPWQYYVREARRMVGEYVFTQHDVLEDITKPDSIGMASYQMDSHNVQRVVTSDGAVVNEGDMYLAVKPWEIPYRSLVPKRSEAVNLLVPVCISGSHTAYGSFRQEPAMMIAGQAAGTAAAIAVRKNLDVQDVPLPELQEKLVAGHAVLHWQEFAVPQAGDSLTSNGGTN